MNKDMKKRRGELMEICEKEIHTEETVSGRECQGH